MKGSIVGLKIGSKRTKARIVDLESKLFDPNDKNERVTIYVQTENGAPFQVGEVWIKNHRNELVAKGLWIEKDYTGDSMHATSLLARFLQFMGVSDPADLIGKEVYLEPKENGYNAIVAYDEN